MSVGMANTMRKLNCGPSKLDAQTKEINQLIFKVFFTSLCHNSIDYHACVLAVHIPDIVTTQMPDPAHVRRRPDDELFREQSVSKIINISALLLYPKIFFEIFSRF